MSFASAIAAALTSAAGVAGVSVNVARGDDDIDITATIGRTDFEAVGETGAVTRFTSRDFLVLATAYDFGAGPVDPRRNDVITATIGGVEKVFQVLDINGVCFSKDSHGVMIRVHTKQVS